MIVQAQCPSCSTTAGVDESFAGRRVRCRKCGERFQIDPSLFGLPPVDGPESDSGESDEGGDPALNDFLNDLGSDRSARPAPAVAVVAAPRQATPSRSTSPAPVAVSEPEEPAAPRPKNVPLMLLSLILLGGTIAFFVWIDQVKREADASPKAAAAPAAASETPAPKS